MKTRNPKSEIRNKFKIKKLKFSKASDLSEFGNLNFPLLNLFRIWWRSARTFGFRIWMGLFVLLYAGRVPAATNPISADDIPPLRPPRPELPPGFWEQYGGWVVAGGAVLLCLLAGMVWLLFRPKPPVPLPPATQARKELEPLGRQPEDGALLSRVSQVVRHYIGAAFGLPPGELTTGEFCRVLAGAEQVGPQLSTAVGDFLRQCDQRKFAPAPALPPLGAVPRALQLIETAEARQGELRRQQEEARQQRKSEIRKSLRTATKSETNPNA
jgi:hypothetical protein